MASRCAVRPRQKRKAGPRDRSDLGQEWRARGSGLRRSYPTRARERPQAQPREETLMICPNGWSLFGHHSGKGVCPNDTGALKGKGIRAEAPEWLSPKRAPFGQSGGNARSDRHKKRLVAWGQNPRRPSKWATAAAAFINRSLATSPSCAWPSSRKMHH